MKALKIALALAFAAFSSFTAQARNDLSTAYMFGLASSFSDSTIYITSVQKVDSVLLTNKSMFLDNRENYSSQLRDYLETIGEPRRTCIVVFDKDFKKAEKKWAKIYGRYTQQHKAKRLKSGEKPKEAPTPWQVKSIDESKFTFKAVEPNETEKPMTKQEKKEAKQKQKEEKLKQKAEMKHPMGEGRPPKPAR